MSNANHNNTDPNFEGPYVELDSTLCDDPLKVKAAKAVFVYGDHKNVSILWDGNTGVVTHAEAVAHLGVYARGALRPYPVKFKLALPEMPLCLFDGIPEVLRALYALIEEQKETAFDKERPVVEALIKRKEAEAIAITKSSVGSISTKGSSIIPVTEAQAAKMIGAQQQGSPAMNRAQRRRAMMRSRKG